MKPSTCSFCQSFRLVQATLHFDCLECGQRMLLIDVPGVEHLYHCPGHCSTLAPNREMITTAQGRH
jgi:hypothetical protein